MHCSSSFEKVSRMRGTVPETGFDSPGPVLLQAVHLQGNKEEAIIQVFAFHQEPHVFKAL